MLTRRSVRASLVGWFPKPDQAHPTAQLSQKSHITILKQFYLGIY